MSNHQMSWEDAVVSLRNRPDQADLVRACYYDDPLLDAAKRYHEGGEWKAMRKLLPARIGRALDIGSGRGISAFALASDGWRTSALEPDPSAVVGAAAIRSLAEEGGLAIDVCETWGESLPFANSIFDVAHCRAVMHHARDLKSFMHEVSRVLKPGGTFIGSREHVVSKHADISAFQSTHPLHSLYGGEYAYLLSEYKSAIKEAGLSLTACLNPLASEINIAPRSRDEIKSNWARKFGVPALVNLIPDVLLYARGSMINTPGRLYTFVAIKPA